MTQSPKDFNQEEIRQEFWHWMLENPDSYQKLGNKIGIGVQTLIDFLDPDCKRVMQPYNLIKIKNFLKRSYAERDAAMGVVHAPSTNASEGSQDQT